MTEELQMKNEPSLISERSDRQFEKWVCSQFENWLLFSHWVSEVKLMMIRQSLMEDMRRLKSELVVIERGRDGGNNDLFLLSY